MDTNFASFKLLEDVHLKATYNLRIGDREFEPGETIALFDKIQMSGFNEIKSWVAARGGFDNRGLVYWETTREMQFSFVQGVFSKTQFALLNNSNLITYGENEPILITTTEEIESDENRYIQLKYEVYDQLFVYSKETGERVNVEQTSSGIRVDEPYESLVATYRYSYNNGAQVAEIGQQFLRGFLELEGRTRVKDDTSGLVTTGIIRIPKLKLMSGLSMRLGTQANPVVGNFQAVGVPVGSRHSSYVAEFLFLNNDIDSDM